MVMSSDLSALKNPAVENITCLSIKLLSTNSYKDKIRKYVFLYFYENTGKSAREV